MEEVAATGEKTRIFDKFSVVPKETNMLPFIPSLTIKIPAHS